MTCAAVDAGSAQIAHTIGDAKHSGVLNQVTHKAAHGALAVTSAKLTGRDPIGAAIGAVVSETAAEVMDKPGATQEARQKIAQKARIIGDTVAFLAGRDVASAVSAGLVSKFVPDTDKKLPFSAHAARNLKKAAIHTATSTVANGGKIGRNALSAATGAIVDAGAASVAQEIGRAYRNGSGDMSWLTHKICHFVLGGGSAAFKGEDPLSGAVGATIGEVVADAMIARALEQTRADVLEQLEDFRANYGTLPPVQRRGIINSNYLPKMFALQA